MISLRKEATPCRSGKCFIQVEAAVVDRMRAMRRPGEDLDVILRLVEIEPGQRR